LISGKNLQPCFVKFFFRSNIWGIPLKISKNVGFIIAQPGTVPNGFDLVSDSKKMLVIEIRSWW
jgi:hypothetical protein